MLHRPTPKRHAHSSRTLHRITATETGAAVILAASHGAMYQPGESHCHRQHRTVSPGSGVVIGVAFSPSRYPSRQPSCLTREPYAPKPAANGVFVCHRQPWLSYDIPVFSRQRAEIPCGAVYRTDAQTSLCPLHEDLPTGTHT